MTGSSPLQVLPQQKRTVLVKKHGKSGNISPFVFINIVISKKRWNFVAEKTRGEQKLYNMKYATIYIISVLMVLLLSSCNKDEKCPDAYEGAGCATLKIAKFINYWKGSDACKNNESYYLYMQIATTVSDTKAIVEFIGPYGEIVHVTATLIASNELKIEKQYVDENNDISMEGNYTVSNDTLYTSNVNFSNENIIDTCKGTYTINH
jgi:hypothetical protein